MEKHEANSQLEFVRPMANGSNEDNLTNMECTYALLE